MYLKGKYASSPDDPNFAAWPSIEKEFPEQRVKQVLVDLVETRNKIFAEYTNGMRDSNRWTPRREREQQELKGVCRVSCSGACRPVGRKADVSAAAGRPVDNVTGCPKDGKYSAVFAVLLDTTDSLSPVQQEVAQKKLDEFAEEVPRYGKIEVFEVRPSSDRLIEPLLEVCNPGRASDTNEWTGNPRLMEKRWHGKFMDPLNKSLRSALSDTVSAKQSPIMEEIQQVSAQAFFETPPNTSKRLAIVSDMLQNSACFEPVPPPRVFQRI